MAEPTAAELRQQYRSKLEGSIAQGRGLLERYQAAYPDLAQVDWPAVQSALVPNPVYGVNIHGRPTDLSPAWIAEQTIEPVEFGSFADPVSQMAFLAAPGLLRGAKATLETMGSPGPRGLTAIAGERGNLGPVPRNQAGEALPQSAVRNEQGQLKRLYHGTGAAYPDFDVNKMNPGDWARGIFMTTDPEVAAGYALRGKAVGGNQPLLLVSPQEARQAITQTPGLTFSERQAMAELPDDMLAETLEKMVRNGYEVPQGEKLYGFSGGNIRPVYADLRKPLDLDAMADRSLLNQIIRTYDEMGAPVPRTLTTQATNRQMYDASTRLLGTDETVRRLQETGYDGLMHAAPGKTYGQPHQVYVAFSSEQVYPSVNVEGTP